MRKLQLLILITFTLFSYSFAQDNSLLWKISGNGLSQDSYLFGTMHLLCPEDFELKEKVKLALSNTAVLTMEVDAFNPTNQALMKDLMAPNKDFLKSLSQEKINTIEEILKTHQIPMQIFDFLSPVGIMSVLAMKSFNCPDPTAFKMMENELSNIAKEEKKPIKELENIKFQFDLLGSFFTAEELYNYVTKMDEYPALTGRMVKAYKEENLEDFTSIMFDNSYLTKENQELLLTKRNENWIKIMPELMKESPTFFAVGAGHLIGENGMISLLKKAGYQLTPIFN